MNINEESEIIKNSMNATINDLKEYPVSFPMEEDIQLRLYVHLCNEFHKKQKGSFSRIKLEYTPFSSKQKEINKEYSLHLPIEKSHMKHIFDSEKYTVQPNVFKIFMSNFIVKGIFDIAIINEKDKAGHVIEIKKLCDAAVHPELKSETHRGLEDIYVLTDLLKASKSCKIDEKCRGYNLIYIEEKIKKSRIEEDYNKMKFFLDDIKKAYSNAGLYHISIEPDNRLIKKLNKLSY
jgi:hypothetical protein